MKAYLAHIYTSASTVPQLRALPCETDHEVGASLADLIAEWIPNRLTGAEVFEGDRLVSAYDPDDLLRLSTTHSPSGFTGIVSEPA